VLGDWRESRAHVERALVVHRAAGDQSSEGRALAALGDTWFYEDRLDEAQKSYAEALAIHRQLGERAAEGVALSRLASVAMERGDAAAARELYRGSVDLHREVGDRRALASTSGYLAILEQEEGDLAAAEERFRHAVELAREIENRRTEGIFTGYLAGCLLEMGRLGEAAETYQRAVDITAEVGAGSTCALFQAGLGALRAMRGDVAGAEAIFAAAEAQLGRMREQTFVAAAVDLLGGFLDIARGAPRSAACRLAKAGGGLSQTDVRFAARLLERALDAAGEPPFEGAMDVGGEGGAEAFEGGPEAFAARGSSTMAPPVAGAGTVVADAPPDALVVARSGRWFRAPQGEVVSLQRRRALRLIMAALAAQRAQQPDTGIDLHAVAAAGWPGERLHPEAAADRVYTAIATLRRMGLRTALLSRDDGYLLDPALHFLAGDG
jgi:tetratricopeptide (TPR) repeat protein